MLPSVQADKPSLPLRWLAQVERGAGRAGLSPVRAGLGVSACVAQCVHASQLAHFRTKGCKKPVGRGSCETLRCLIPSFLGFQINRVCSLLPLPSNKKTVLFQGTLCFG